MEATMLLCDFAESANGKLYVMGGGWTEVSGQGPINCSLAIKLDVRWDETNRKHAAELVLVDLDGGVVTGSEGEDVMVGLEFETGRPPGSIPGDDITTTLAFRFQSLDLEPAGYKFTFTVDGTELAASRFRVLG